MLTQLLLLLCIPATVAVPDQCVSIKVAPPKGLFQFCTISTKRCMSSEYSTVDIFNEYLSDTYRTLSPELCVFAFNRPTECPVYGGVFNPALCQIGKFSCDYFTRLLNNCNTDAHCTTQPFVCCASRRKLLAQMCTGPNDKMLDALIDTLRTKPQQNGGCRDTIDCLDLWSAGVTARPGVALVIGLALAAVWLVVT